EGTGPDCIANVAHEPAIESQVMKRQEDGPEHLISLEQMVKIGPAITPTGFTSTIRLQRRWISPVSGVSKPQSAFRDKSAGISAISRGQYTVEHIDAPGDGLHEVSRPAYTHQVARLVRRQKLGCRAKNFEHLLLGFADT